MKKALWLVVIPFALCANAYAAQSELRIRLENRLRFEYFSNYEFAYAGVESDDLTYIFNSLRLGVYKGGFTGSVQVDTRYFADHLYALPSDKNARKGVSPEEFRITKNQWVNIEKAQLSYSSGATKITFGDYYLVLLDGILTAFKKEDDFNYDRSLRGAMARFEEGSLSVVSFAGLTNILNIDPTNYSYRADPMDLLYGGEFKLYSSEVHLGATLDFVGAQYGFMLTDHDRRFLVNDRAGLAGGSLFGNSLFGGKFDWKFIAAAMRRNDYEPNFTDEGLVEPKNVRHEGSALYAYALLRIKPFVVLLEGKNYKDWRFVRSREPLPLNRLDYSQGPFPIPRPLTPPEDLRYTDDIWYNYAPTLLPVDTEFLNNQDAIGGRIKVSWRLWQRGPLIYADTIHQKTAGVEGLPGLERRHTEHHIYAGFEWTIAAGYRIAVDGGWWEDRMRTENGKSLQMLEVAKLKATTSVRIAPLKTSTELSLKWRRKTKGEDEPIDEFDSELTLSLPYGFKVAGLFSFERQSGSDTRFYPGGAISYKWHHNVELSLFAGKLRGGYRCFGGTCRKYPDFEGVRADFIVRF